MEYTAIGDDVNLAARIQSVSDVNGIAIGERTAELNKDRFRLEEIKNVSLKGKSKSVSIFKVLT